MSQTRDQQRFTISEVAADWHEPMVFQRVGEETEKASEAKSDLTNGMTSKALVEDLNVLTGWYGWISSLR